MLMSPDKSSAVIVHECDEGTLILGDYTHTLCILPTSNHTHVPVHVFLSSCYLLAHVPQAWQPGHDQR